MRFKVNNKYVIDAKSYDDAIRVIKMLDAMETYSIRWIDTYAKAKGYGPDFWRYNTEIKANNVKEALEKLAKKVALGGTGTANCLVMHVPNSHATYQFSGRLSELLKKTKEQLGDSVKDARTISPWALSPGKRILSEDGDKATVISVKGDRRNGYDVVVKLDDGSRDEWYYEANDVITLTDSIKDAELEADVDLDFLIKDELEAIDGYRKMIAKTSNPQLLSVLSHILDEETEHVEELRAAQAGVYEVKDSIKDGHASPDTELDRAHINYDAYDEPTRGTHYFEFGNKSDAEEAKKYLSTKGYNPGNVKTKRDGLDTYYILQFKE